MNSRRKQQVRALRRQATERSSRSAAAGGGGDLSRSALRLLTLLAEPNAAAIEDPTREGSFILRAGDGPVSLARGSFPASVADELRARDLLAPLGGRAPASLAITPAGRAYLKRCAAARGEGFRAQHAILVRTEITDETGTSRVTVNAAESPLAWLRRRRDADGEPLIGDAEFEAGERLRRDLTFAGMLPSVTARWEGAIGSGGGMRDPAGATDTMISARQRSRAALDAVGGDMADLLVDLCGFLKGLEQIERERRWPPRSGKVVVRLALRRLAEHYGLAGEASGPERSRGMRSWREVLEDSYAAV